MFYIASNDEKAKEFDACCSIFNCWSARSEKSSPLFILLFLGSLQCSIGIFLLRKWISNYLDFDKISYYSTPLFLLLTAALIIPIRGGFQLAPINESAVFFSEKTTRFGQFFGVQFDKSTVSGIP